MDLGWSHLTQGDKDCILRGIADGVAYGGPFHVEIHPSERCNIDCFFCSTTTTRAQDEISLTRLAALLEEMKGMGTRALRLSGGGEPLFHRESVRFLEAVVASGIPIENLTTNAVLLDERRAPLVARACDAVTISLNTPDAPSYARMMATTEKNFDRVLANVRRLLDLRASGRPFVSLQFLVWRGNYRSIPAMYRLARELRVDSVLFNGLAFLKPDERMTPPETEEMMGLYEEVLRVDEYRSVGSIASFEQDLAPRLHEVNARLHEERTRKGRLARLRELVTRRDFTLRQKLAHVGRRRALARLRPLADAADASCIVGWHSMVVRGSGVVAPCCILQGGALGDVGTQSLREIWYGERYASFRRQLRRIRQERAGWSHDPGTDDVVVPMCATKGASGCSMATFYYEEDAAFLEGLAARPLEPLPPPAPQLAATSST